MWNLSVPKRVTILRPRVWFVADIRKIWRKYPSVAVPPVHYFTHYINTTLRTQVLSQSTSTCLYSSGANYAVSSGSLDPISLPPPAVHQYDFKNANLWGWQVILFLYWVFQVYAVLFRPSLICYASQLLYSTVTEALPRRDAHSLMTPSV